MKLKNIFKKENKTVAKATIETLAKNQLEKVIGGTDTIGQGASLLGGALPGGAVISAAVSSVGTKGSGASSASYAATGRTAK
jgi:hypothetical protein